MTIRPLAAFLGLVTFGALPYGSLTALLAQSTQQSDAPQDNNPSLTLHAETRIVLADIIVTDHNGKPVHGLSLSDFQVFDNDQPQHIASFEEHNASSSATTYAPPTTNTASNSYQHLPPVLNALVLDTTNLELPDQMYLHIQLTRFLKALPTGQPIAIFERHGDYSVLLQPFTSDHALLQAAVNHALPRIVLNGREYRSDVDTLHQIGAYLSQVPGRKNLLWFSGGSTAFLLNGLSELTAPTPAGPPPSTATAAATQAVMAPSVPLSTPSMGEDPAALRQVFDELESARIAVYPIDARGLTTEGDSALEPQHTQMNDVAQATGGEAFYNRNSLALAASHIVSTDSTSYTLTWSPQNFHYDNKWHSIRITCSNRDYHLSYRRGYFADKAHPIKPGSSKHSTVFTADAANPTAPDLRSPPLLFEASVRRAADPPAPGTQFVALRPAAPPAKGTTAFAIDYTLSTSALTSAPIDGEPRATVFFAVIALDSDGERIAQTFDRVRFPLDPNSPSRKLEVEQQIDLRRGGDFLAVIVWDPVSGRFGTLQLPVNVSAPNKSQ